jgi:hypothetical protein
MRTIHGNPVPAIAGVANVHGAIGTPSAQGGPHRAIDVTFFPVTELAMIADLLADLEQRPADRRLSLTKALGSLVSEYSAQMQHQPAFAPAGRRLLTLLPILDALEARNVDHATTHIRVARTLVEDLIVTLPRRERVLPSITWQEPPEWIDSRKPLRR